jgi:NDP-sugar pyrophosphorylase family protein
MIAVILPPGPKSEMCGLDAEQSRSLLPLGDRPVLQHIIESLATQGITSIELITGHAPEKVEGLLGNGDRWGCDFRYHLAAQPDRPYRSLRVIERTKTEPWVLIHADRYPCVTFSSDELTGPRVYCEATSAARDEAPGEDEPRDGLDGWGGTILFPAGDFGEQLWDKSTQELQTYLEQGLLSGDSTAIESAEWIDASTPDALLDTQARLLGGKLNGLMISGIERQTGIWVSRNVNIHPTAILTAPLYIGPNCRIHRGVRLGPDVVISSGCIVDSNTVVEQSLAMAGSYIGEGLELNRTIVNHDLLVNVRLGTRVNISESFLLGGLESKSRQGWLARGVQSLLAALLILIFSPVLLLSLLYFLVARRLSYVSVKMAKAPMGPAAIVSSSYLLPCVGADAWNVCRPAGWGAFTRQFLPGLFAVLAGRVGLVGLPPRSAAELQRLPEEWRALYTTGRDGLITEAAVAAADPHDETQLYLADAYYAARRSWLHDTKLATNYMLRLVVGAPEQHP